MLADIFCTFCCHGATDKDRKMTNYLKSKANGNQPTSLRAPPLHVDKQVALFDNLLNAFSLSSQFKPYSSSIQIGPGINFTNNNGSKHKRVMSGHKSE